MKRLEYIGLKPDGERAFKERTGIEWMPNAQHDVADEHAELMLKHTDVWREVTPKATKAAALASAPAPASSTGTAGNDKTPQLPAWAKKGIELGATDEQLEAVAQAGGPETEQGAELWKDATGTDWEPADTTAKPAAKKAPAKKPAAKKTAKKAK